MAADETDRGARPGRRGEKGRSVAEHLGEAIRSGRFVPGQRLVEAELTAELGVSRGPVREALRRLSAEGLIELVPNRGALVRRLSQKEALDLFQIRSELEALAARLAARRMAEPCVRRAFEAAVAPIWGDAPRHSTSAYIEENRRFHGAVMAASGNCQLVNLSEQKQLSLILSQISHQLTSESIAASICEHRAIAEAILAGDGRKAESRIRRHMARAAEIVRRMPPQVFRSESGDAALN